MNRDWVEAYLFTDADEFNIITSGPKKPANDNCAGQIRIDGFIDMRDLRVGECTPLNGYEILVNEDDVGKGLLIEFKPIKANARSLLGKSCKASFNVVKRENYSFSLTYCGIDEWSVSFEAEFEGALYRTSSSYCPSFDGALLNLRRTLEYCGMNRVPESGQKGE